MFKRLPEFNQKKSFFLFGARNTGKSTLIESIFSEQTTLFIDLLNFEQMTRFSNHPNEFFNIVMSLPEHITHVVLDEIQKVPALLDVIQRLMRKTNKVFVMTGSSARKLKYGSANLLAGRALVYYLFPFSFVELGDLFDLEHALAWGTLPEIMKCETDNDRQAFLSAYAHTYLKEEIIAEQLVRRLEPFNRFLEVAAQSNGKVVNFSNIAKDTGMADKTVAAYYTILEDTLIGFMLPAFHNSFRKRLLTTPKFYFFDPGVVRALARMTDTLLRESTRAYGEAFEHYVIVESLRLGRYKKPNYKFSYLRTKDDIEIDLVIERPGDTTLLVEIKSANRVDEGMLSSFIRLSKDIPNTQAICLSRDPYAKQFQHVKVLPWESGLLKIFDLTSI